MTFGANLRRIRNYRGLTLRELSELTGIDATSLQKYETSIYSRPKPATIKKLAEALKVSPYALSETERDRDADMHRLFGMVHFYTCDLKDSLFEGSDIIEQIKNDEFSENAVYIRLDHLGGELHEWLRQIEEYRKVYKACENFPEPLRLQTLSNAEDQVRQWEDTYPEFNEPEDIEMHEFLRTGDEMDKQYSLYKRLQEGQDDRQDDED